MGDCCAWTKLTKKIMKKAIRIIAAVLGMAAFFALGIDSNGCKLVALAVLIGAILLGRSTYSDEEWDE